MAAAISNTPRLILVRYPQVATANIHTAAILADEPPSAAILAHKTQQRHRTGGPYGWDTLTHLCFSRYLRLDPTRSDASSAQPETLLDAEASPTTGWYETIDHPNSARPFESPPLRRRRHRPKPRISPGSSSNAEPIPTTKRPRTTSPKATTTPSPRFCSKAANSTPTASQRCSSAKRLARTKRHPAILAHGGDPNARTTGGTPPFHQSLRRDNGLEIILTLVNHGADPTPKPPVRATPQARSPLTAAAPTPSAKSSPRKPHIRLTNLQPPDQLHSRLLPKPNAKPFCTLTAHQPNLLANSSAHGGTLLSPIRRQRQRRRHPRSGRPRYLPRLPSTPATATSTSPPTAPLST